MHHDAPGIGPGDCLRRLDGRECKHGGEADAIARRGAVQSKRLSSPADAAFYLGHVGATVGALLVLASEGDDHVKGARRVDAHREHVIGGRDEGPSREGALGGLEVDRGESCLEIKLPAIREGGLLGAAQPARLGTAICAARATCWRELYADVTEKLVRMHLAIWQRHCSAFGGAHFAGRHRSVHLTRRAGPLAHRSRHLRHGAPWARDDGLLAQLDGLTPCAAVDHRTKPTVTERHRGSELARRLAKEERRSASYPRLFSRIATEGRAVGSVSGQGQRRRPKYSSRI